LGPSFNILSKDLGFSLEKKWKKAMIVVTLLDFSFHLALFILQASLMVSVVGDHMELIRHYFLSH